MPKALTNKEFIDKVKEIFGDKYDYSKIEYINGRVPVKLICPIHGEFEQKPNIHLKGHGCRGCSSRKSKVELEILNYVKSIYKGEIKTNVFNVISPYELDIYLPEINKAIEVNGHYWHKKAEITHPGRHKEKAKLAKEKGIKIINILNLNWNKNQDKIKELIKRA